jgi:hypothetical protein
MHCITQLVMADQPNPVMLVCTVPLFLRGSCFVHAPAATASCSWKPDVLKTREIALCKILLAKVKTVVISKSVWIPNRP